MAARAKNKKTNNETEYIQEQITDVEYSDVMKKSYIDYSMSVIIARALPDIRDGLKPVQRRIIYDMSELGTFSDKPYKKSARITGDTMGKYHPHGDTSIYDALVVMSQDFKKGRKLVDGHGNFGSIEGDGAAAQRYTEARLDSFSEDVFLSGLKEDVVDFIPNYDESEKEPEILPCKLPNFLINGSEGIAVGMTTSTPPHNISDVIDASVCFLNNPDISNDGLLKVLHGPDFPTGGVIVNKKDLKEIYATGAGKIKIRGKVGFEHGKGSEKDRLVITEIPYTMIGDGISKFLQSVAQLAEDRILPEISDIEDQTSKDGIRIVLELKKGSDCQYVENILYKKTRLEDTFGVNMLAVHDGRPEVMGLKGILSAYTAFQYEINTRKYHNLLAKTEKRIEILEGLIKATDEIDLVIEILRGSKSVKQAKECLVSGSTDKITFKTRTSEKKAKSLHFTPVQADAVLAMTLSRLVGLELGVLQKELREKQKAVLKYNKILSNKNEMKKEIIKELLSLKEKYGTSRKTEIVDAAPVEIKEKEEEEIPVVVLVDKFYYVHCVDASVYEKSADAISNDYRHIVYTTNKGKVSIFCNSGKAHIVKVQDIPYGKIKDKGQPLDNICNYNSKVEDVVGITNTADNKYIFISSDGFVKVVNMSEFNVTRKSIDATKLKDGSSLVSVVPYMETGQIVLSTKKGIYIRFKQSEIPLQKKNAVGATGIKLTENDSIIMVSAVDDASKEIPFGDNKIAAEKIKIMRRGGKGVKPRIS